MVPVLTLAIALRELQRRIARSERIQGDVLKISGGQVPPPGANWTVTGSSGNKSGCQLQLTSVVLGYQWANKHSLIASSLGPRVYPSVFPVITINELASSRPSVEIFTILLPRQVVVLFTVTDVHRNLLEQFLGESCKDVIFQYGLAAQIK